MPDPIRPPEASRRAVLRAAAGVGLGSLVHARGAQDESPEDLLDRGLERIAARTPDANVHRSNHAPMAIEALARLGRADAIACWLDEGLAPGFEPAPRGAPIDPAEWRAALGRHARVGDWFELFARELAEEEFALVLRRWVPRLAPGLAAAATHGVIRTAHAARALSTRDVAVRRHELAMGLAYWAVNYVELPWDGSLAPERDLAAAFARLAPRQPGLAPPRGNLVTGLAVLADTPSFAPAAGWVDARDPARLLGALAPLFARLYLANPAQRIAFTHSITAPSAVRLLLPFLDEAGAELAARRAWQVAAGLYVAYGDPRTAAPASPSASSTERRTTAAEIAERAVASGDVHAIKLAETCLREAALADDPVLWQAALDAATSM